MPGSLTSKFAGAFLGLALGDAFGAPYEGGPLERLLWSFIGTKDGKRRFTDDTQMSIDLAESLLEHSHVNEDDLARRFCESYRWDRGYGPGTVRVLRRIRRGVHWQAAAESVFNGGSYGNGGAMRAPIIGLYFAGSSEDEIAAAARAGAGVTHAHRLAGEGAELIALTTVWALQNRGSGDVLAALAQREISPEMNSRVSAATEFLTEKRKITPRMISKALGNSTAATASCVTAIYLALEYREDPFDLLLQAAIDLGGDVDTIAAMAGAIWGAYNGEEKLPEDKLAKLEQCDRIRGLASDLAMHTARG